MDLKKFNEAQKINSEIVGLNDQIQKWTEGIEFHRVDIVLVTKTGAKLDTLLDNSHFIKIKEVHLEQLKFKLNQLQTKFNAI